MVPMTTTLMTTITMFDADAISDNADSGTSVLLLGVRLPLVDGAVTAGEGVGLGILKGVQDGLVLPVEGNAAKEKE